MPKFHTFQKKHLSANLKFFGLKAPLVLVSPTLTICNFPPLNVFLHMSHPRYNSNHGREGVPSQRRGRLLIQFHVGVQNSLNTYCVVSPCDKVPGAKHTKPLKSSLFPLFDTMANNIGNIIS